MSYRGGTYSSTGALTRPESSRKYKNYYDDLSYSTGTASSTSQLVHIASYGMDGPVMRIFSGSSEVVDPRSNEDSVETSNMRTRVAVTVYDGSETDSQSETTGSGTTGVSGCATRSSTTSITSQAATFGGTSTVIPPPYQLKRRASNRNQLEQKEKLDSNARSPSLFGTMFSCFNPYTPNGIYPTNVNSKSKLPQVERDTLDTVFGAVEGCVCTETTDLDPKTEALLTMQHDRTYKEDMLDTIFEGMERGICTRGRHVPSTSPGNSLSTSRSSPRFRSEQRMRDMAASKARALTKFEKDMIENRHKYYTVGSASSQKDMLDRVFEGIESVACRDDQEAMGDRSRLASSLSTAKRGVNRRVAARESDTDTLDYVCGNFEHAVGIGGDARSHHNNMIRESKEETACKDTVMTGDSQAPIDLTRMSCYSVGNENSVVHNQEAGERKRREILRISRERAGPMQGQVSDDRDVIDRVFEGLESKMCHDGGSVRYGIVQDGREMATNTKTKFRDLGRKSRRVYYIKAGE